MFKVQEAFTLMYGFMTVSNRPKPCAWGQTGGVGGMRLVPPPLRPEGARRPSEAGGCSSSLCQAPEHDGWWQLVLCPSPPLLPCMSTPQAGNRRGEEVKRQERMGGTLASCRIIGFYVAERIQTVRDGKHGSDTMQPTTCSNELTY